MHPLLRSSTACGLWIEGDVLGGYCAKILLQGCNMLRHNATLQGQKSGELMRNGETWTSMRHWVIASIMRYLSKIVQASDIIPHDTTLNMLHIQHPSKTQTHRIRFCSKTIPASTVTRASCLSAFSCIESISSWQGMSMWSNACQNCHQTRSTFKLFKLYQHLTTPV